MIKNAQIIECSEKRESREFWAVNDSDVVKVIGYSCAPENPEYWWCPSIGSSMSTKYLFNTERAALMKAIEETQNELHRIQKALDRLDERLCAL